MPLYKGNDKYVTARNPTSLTIYKRLVCRGNRDYTIEYHESGKDRKKSVFGDLVCQDNGFDTAVFVGNFARYLRFLENDYGKDVRVGFMKLTDCIRALIERQMSFMSLRNFTTNYFTTKYFARVD